MWKDVSKSTLWFGLGCLCFLSSCFTKGVNFRSAVSFFVLLLLLCVCLVVESETPVLVISVFSRPYLDWQFSCWVFRSSQTQFVKGNTCLVCHDVVSLLSYPSFGFGCTQRICVWLFVNVFRNQVEKRSFAKLKEDDILHLAKLILPALNFAISKTRELFSGEPCMTLKVIP